MHSATRIKVEIPRHTYEACAVQAERDGCTIGRMLELAARSFLPPDVSEVGEKLADEILEDALNGRESDA